MDISITNTKIEKNPLVLLEIRIKKWHYKNMGG